MDQGIGTYGTLTVLGVDIPHSRGVDPSVFHIRLVPADTFDRFVDDLTLDYGSESMTFTDVGIAAVPARYRTGRYAYQWSAIGLDRRWKWRYPRISGTYNKRLCDGTMGATTKKNAQELATILFDELGETGYDVSNLPTNVYPPVIWDEALVRLELQWLCDLFAMDVCPKLDDTFSIEALTTTATLPTGYKEITPDTYSYKPAVMPSKVRVQGSELKKQGWLDLTPMGLDADGDLKPLVQLSYMPGGGWGDQWPDAFPDVSYLNRHLAFQTVYRWFAPPPNILLREHLVETGTDIVRDTKHCLPPQLRGTFFILDDLGVSGSDTPYSGKFRIRTDLNLIEAFHPIYQVAAGVISDPMLQINTAYIELVDGQAKEDYTLDEDVTEAKITTEPRVLRHPELIWHDIIDALYQGNTGRNTAVLDAEAQVYADNVAASYSYDKAQDVMYDGIVPLDLTGAYTQVRYVVGNYWAASTRVGVNTEIDVREKQRQQRRAQQRLYQMAERMMI